MIFNQRGGCSLYIGIPSLRLLSPTSFLKIIAMLFQYVLSKLLSLGLMISGVLDEIVVLLIQIECNDEIYWPEEKRLIQK